MSLNIIVSLNFNEFKTHLIDKNQFNEKYLIILKRNDFLVKENNNGNGKKPKSAALNLSNII